MLKYTADNFSTSFLLGLLQQVHNYNNIYIHMSALIDTSFTVHISPRDYGYTLATYGTIWDTSQFTNAMDVVDYVFTKYGGFAVRSIVVSQ